MRIRLGELEDEPEIKELFEKQGLNVDLPLASQDPAVLFTLVGVNDSRVRVAVIGRLGLEIHLVVDPKDVEAARRVREISAVAEGVVISKSQELVRRGFPAITDAQAWVPNKLPEMIKAMGLLGWAPEQLDVVTPFYRVVGGR